MLERSLCQGNAAGVGVVYAVDSSASFQQSDTNMFTTIHSGSDHIEFVTRRLDGKQIAVDLLGGN